MILCFLVLQECENHSRRITAATFRRFAKNALIILPWETFRNKSSIRAASSITVERDDYSAWVKDFYLRQQARSTRVSGLTTWKRQS